jgi:prepilin-type N-terminal cleavage/methylation domain-containing protein
MAMIYKLDYAVPIRKHHSGFSLVEMAVVLVITSLILGAVISMGNAQITQSRISTTKQKEEAIKTALVSFIARNNRLPCPANPALDPANPRYGREATTPGTCDTVPTAAGVVMGVIPWITLGISDEGAQDGYYNRFTYAVTTTATNLDINTIAGLRGNIVINNALGVQSNDCTPAGGASNPCLIVVMLLSHGANANGAYTSGGTQITPPTGPDESENADIDAVFVMKDFAAGDPNPFDDILLGLNASDLLSPLTQNGALPDANAQVRHKLEIISGAVKSFATVNRAGLPGSRIYPIPAGPVADLNLPALNTTDPWGNTIEYDRGVATVSAGDPPGNTAYMINSLGPDGAVGGNDDIGMVVLVSEAQAQFSTYGW